MRLVPADAMARLAAHDHGVFCTVHADRGVDAVPVAFALDGVHLGIPVDLVKPKASLRLQRERNLEADPRATLLVEQWDRDDWSRLWWVRVELHHVDDAARADALADALAAKYPQYRDRPFARVIVLQVVDVSGWSSSGVDGSAQDQHHDDDDDQKGDEPSADVETRCEQHDGSVR